MVFKEESRHSGLIFEAMPIMHFDGTVFDGDKRHDGGRKIREFNDVKESETMHFVLNGETGVHLVFRR